MSTAKRRHTKEHTFEGERACAPILDWINGPPHEYQVEQVARVRQLLEQLLELHELWKKEIEEKSETGECSDATSSLVTEKSDDMASTLRRYATVPYILPGDQFYVGVAQLWPANDGTVAYEPVWTPDGSMPINEFGVVTMLMQVTLNGWLPKIGRCNCGLFFFKRFSNQTAHSAECRKKARLGTEEWRAYNRRKQREYYWLHKNKNTK